MADPVEPTVGNFEDDKHAAGYVRHRKASANSLILEFSGFEVVKDKDGEG